MRITNYAEELEKASRYKENFLMNVSHEIRTPMTAILGYTDLLKKNQIGPERIDETISIIDHNAKHLLSLIDEILDISKVESDQFSIEVKAFDFHKLITESLRLMLSRALSKNLKINLIQKSTIPYIISSDEVRLKQIILNILGNSLKFTYEGEVSVEIEAVDDLISINVIDEGPGIPKDKWEDIFIPFEQADNSITRSHQGTGLGLVLSRELARRLGGDVKIVESTVGKGSTFNISFKDLDFSQNRLKGYGKIDIKTESEKEESKKEQNLNDKKILIVDDAKENTRLFSLYLKSTGALVEIANSGFEALDLVKENNFDVVLLDLQMPEMDGFQVLENLQELKVNAPVLALTAHGMDSEKAKTKAAGFYDHIVKPVGSSELIEAIKHAILV